jgi:uracil-DNA glycosylase family protein
MTGKKNPPPSSQSGTTKTAEPFVPATRSLAKLDEASQSCRGCELYKNATQAVFGRGQKHAPIILLGEQPGDREDHEGAPFVGPAGLLLDKALAEAGLSRKSIYLTNAVKHFKWKPQGKKRIHQRPNASEINACRPWLRAELELIRPRILVCMGATAAQSAFSKIIKIGEMRSRFLPTPYCQLTLVTVHPSSILREIDPVARAAAFERFVADLRMARERLDARD